MTHADARWLADRLCCRFHPHARSTTPAAGSRMFPASPATFPADSTERFHLIYRGRSPSLVRAVQRDGAGSPPLRWSICWSTDLAAGGFAGRRQRLNPAVDDDSTLAAPLARSRPAAWRLGAPFRLTVPRDPHERDPRGGAGASGSVLHYSPGFSSRARSPCSPMTPGPPARLR